MCDFSKMIRFSNRCRIPFRRGCGEWPVIFQAATPMAIINLIIIEIIAKCSARRFQHSWWRSGYGHHADHRLVFCIFSCYLYYANYVFNIICFLFPQYAANPCLA